jgi:hypothetical protein
MKLNNNTSSIAFLIVFFLTLPILFLSCVKNKDETKRSFDEIFQIKFDLDGTPVTKVYDKGTENEITGLNEGLTTGDALSSKGFAYRPPNAVIDIWLGVSTIKSSDPAASFASFKTLFSPGAKIYDTLYNGGQKETNRVEITYRDKDGEPWSSTKITTSGPPNYRIIKREIIQPGSNFIIATMREVSSANDVPPNGVIVTGTFNCIFYHVDGNETKTIKNGTFTALTFL